VPMMNELGIDASWEVIVGSEDFYACTKSMHNALQGNPLTISERLLKEYERVQDQNADMMRERLVDADFVFIHDPQPAGLLQRMPERRGNWIWRCHIDLSHPNRQVWRFLRRLVEPYDASIFSLAAFAQRMPHDVYLIAPSIDA